MTHVGEIVRSLREAQNITQAALAEKVDVDPSLISKLETGATYGSLKTLRKIAHILGVSVSVLMDEPQARAAGE